MSSRSSEATIHWVQFGAGDWKYSKIEAVNQIGKSWLERYQIKLIVYEPVSEVIERWIN